MKKRRIFKFVFFVMLSCINLSFVKNDNESEIKLFIESDRKTKFDMYQSTNASKEAETNSKTLRKLETPFHSKMSLTDGRFIFKSADKSKLKVNVESDKNGNKASVHAEWRIVVVVIKSGNIEIFGMD
ncbi:MAG: hypothetical protein JSU09_14575 [Bacteroidetes bacterium]|nr:hypothetical protein [Bacteroidota bacterium]